MSSGWLHCDGLRWTQGERGPLPLLMETDHPCADSRPFPGRFTGPVLRDTCLRGTELTCGVPARGSPYATVSELEE